MDLKIKQWDEAYLKGGNLLFWPHEEIIRFVSKYIRKRIDIDEYAIIQDFKLGLVLGCGIGRHIKYLDEIGMKAYGIDLSEVAITKGKQWFNELGGKNLADQLVVGSILELPYEDNEFDFVVSHGVLDSMEFEIAVQGMKEVARVLKPGGYMYFDVIMDPAMNAYEEIVVGAHEHGTIQSYFDKNKVSLLLGVEFSIIEFKITSISDENDIISNKRAHIVCERR